jgi:DNA-binding MarR family transcriptional regulator
MFPGYLLTRLGEASRRRFGELIEPAGLDGRHFRVITIVGAHPGVTQQHLHEKTSIDTSSMVAVIDDLQERGLAERRTDAEDRRVRAIYLTEEGERTRQWLTRIADELQEEILAPLSDEERGTLHSLLHKLARGHARAGDADAARVER